MKRKLLSYLSNGSLLAGVLLGGWALVKIWAVRASLPAGACPVVTNRPLLYAGIALCLVSFVFALLESRAKKSAACIKGPSEPEDGADRP